MMEQMTGYALLGIGNAESPEMMHARVQEACALAEKMVQNSIEMVEYKGKTMGEWVESVKKLQQYEERLREATKKIERLEAERDAAVAGLKKAANEKGECFECKWYNGKNCTHQDYKTLCSSRDDKWEWRGVQKEE